MVDLSQKQPKFRGILHRKINFKTNSWYLFRKGSVFKGLF